MMVLMRQVDALRRNTQQERASRDRSQEQRHPKGQGRAEEREHHPVSCRRDQKGGKAFRTDAFSWPGGRIENLSC